MGRKKDWNATDEKKLVDNYSKKTIHELMVIFPNRSQESINNKIKRLKAAGKIKGGKESEVIQRSYDQRKGKEDFSTIDL
jgi:predicted CopG family antitoxin